ncbi:MAG: response regulator transcription factor, partial [Eubacteriales bacterium]|nr:response regulator transcription factor [Eubacteriales bacterium]
MYNVLIVDDERMVQELFAAYINLASDRYCLAGTLDDAANADMRCSHNVDLVLMDVCTAHNSSGLEAVAQIKAHHPKVKVIIVTSAPEYRFIKKAKEAKADSFWYKNVSEQALLDVMDRTMAGEHIYPEETPKVEIGFANSGEFTRKELEVLLHLAEGKSSEEIGEDLGMAAGTVKVHTK